MRLFTFTNIRILLLLVVLAFAAYYSSHQKEFSRSWSKPLEVVIFPINGDNTRATANYIQSLQNSDFQRINQWFAQQAKVYSLAIDEPTRFHKGDTINTPPPLLESQNSVLGVVWWGLKMRWWAFQNTPDNTSNLERVRMFVIYQQGKKGEALPHSLGLEKGLIGVVYAYAEQKQNKQNNIVIAHEFLHTVGARDKYSNNGSTPFPEGFAVPDKRPLYPQKRAEIMSGHIPTSKTKSHMALSLRSTLINEFTAREISWLGD